MKRSTVMFLILTVLTILTTLATTFPVGSVANFNPAYMVNNEKWSLSYETYFNSGMVFVAFQPFENGFAGKLGFYANEEGNGLLYSIATEKGNLALGGDFTLSSSGTRVDVEMGLGMVEKLNNGFYLDIRVPQALRYTYGIGINVRPNVRAALSWSSRNLSAAAFGKIDYPWVEGGSWASFSLFGFQLFGYLENGYNSSISSVTRERFEVILQYTISNVKIAYLYDYTSSTISPSMAKHGLRISVDW